MIKFKDKEEFYKCYEDYDLIPKNSLGKGAFGEVFKSFNKKVKIEYALKMIRVS